MSTPAVTTVVITDTNVLINFLHIGQLALLAELSAYRFQLPPEVLQELTDPGQKASVDNAIAVGQLDLLVIDELDALALFGDLRDLMGRGEAACLALAATVGCHIASDEKKRFRRKAIELISEARILGTEDLLLEAIRFGRITVAQADGYKVVLAESRYTMPFASFAERL
jgi:predicted nucleic acid-binding protein